MATCWGSSNRTPLPDGFLFAELAVFDICFALSNPMMPCDGVNGIEHVLHSSSVGDAITCNA